MRPLIVLTAVVGLIAAVGLATTAAQDGAQPPAGHLVVGSWRVRGEVDG